MAGKITNYVFRKRLRKYLKNDRSNKQFVNYDKAQTILLLFENSVAEENVAVKKIIQLLQKDGKKVTAWGYTDKKEIKSPASDAYRILNPKDFRTFQKPVNHLLQELISTEYDLLIDISTEKLIPIDYLIFYANAKCKTGIKKNDISFYDFVIDMDSYLLENKMQKEDLDYAFLFNQILFYLKSIQTKD